MIHIAYPRVFRSFLQVLSGLSLFLVLTACTRGISQPKIVKVDIFDLKAQGPMAVMTLRLTITNLEEKPFNIVLQQLKVYRDQRTLVSELKNQQSYLLNPGNNILYLPLEFNINNLLHNNAQALFQDILTLQFEGRLRFSYDTVSDQGLRFSHSMTISIDRLLKVLGTN